MRWIQCVVDDDDLSHFPHMWTQSTVHGNRLIVTWRQCVHVHCSYLLENYTLCIHVTGSHLCIQCDKHWDCFTPTTTGSSEWQEQSLHPHCVDSISSTISTSFYTTRSISRFHSREFLSFCFFGFRSVFPLSFFVSIYFMLIFTLKFIDYEYVKCINTLEWVYPIPIC